MGLAEVGNTGRFCTAKRMAPSSPPICTIRRDRHVTSAMAFGQKMLDDRVECAWHRRQRRRLVGHCAQSFRYNDEKLPRSAS
ncbi:hypothetical protein ATE62_04270 [Sphingopyxis sp. HIX]|nr:hypothetical protein ATE62_04270 [Sphingopyxis sp. HIX]KTE85238.1 hypothetical protein ATE72_05095 [Sphingopyxis sp. HXXIV]